VETRAPAVARSFYPAAADLLRSQVRGWLDGVRLDDAERAPPPPAALIVPHAGYRYSGQVAAAAYARLDPSVNEGIRRVVLLGPAHFVPIRGVAVPSAGAFDTPLGPVPVDRSGIEAALAMPGVRIDDDAHEPEHSLEVQLPFLLETVGDRPIVPLLVGAATADLVAGVLDRVWTATGTLSVISSDLSHYLSRAAARARDRATADAIEALEPDRIGPTDACGGVAIRALLPLARARRLQARAVALATSADAGAPDDRVVGYGAFVFRPEGTPGETAGGLPS
jgi:MEMO1 family protein